MVRLFWFIIKLAVIAAAAVWIAGLQGHVDVEFLYGGAPSSPDLYTSEIDVRAFLFGLLVILVAIIFIYEIVRFFVRAPKEIRRYNYLRRHEKGLQALTLGLTSIAAGDAKDASWQARRAEKFLPPGNSLPLLLKAQSARLRGDEIEAQQNFEALLAHEDTGFLGLRGLLQSSLERGDEVKALELARDAAHRHPKRGWILKTVYELEIKARAWDAALLTLYRAEKAGAIPPEKALSDRVAMLLLQAEADLQSGGRKRAYAKLKKAFRYNPSFAPAAGQLAKLYIQDGKQRAAIKVGEEAWSAQPHPDLAKLWDALQPPGKPTDTLARLHWHERLAALNPVHVESHIMLARINMDQKFWGDARHYLKQAEDAGATDARTYRLRAELEDNTKRIHEFVMGWQDKAAEAPPEKTWVCHETGHIYDRWYAIAQPHGGFNTIIWDHPYARTGNTVNISNLMQDTLVEATPRASKAARAF
ncbi:MAG: heme biosynthesis protein HemY [Alphaproteobacteria bacterium]